MVDFETAPNIWRTKDNKIISIKKMSDSHIENCINLLYISLSNAYCRAFNMHREDELDSDTWYDILAKINELEDELYKRHLEIGEKQ